MQWQLEHLLGMDMNNSITAWVADSDKAFITLNTVFTYVWGLAFKIQSVEKKTFISLPITLVKGLAISSDFFELFIYLWQNKQHFVPSGEHLRVSNIQWNSFQVLGYR